MRKTREILRLAFEARLSQRAIARSMGVSNSTISEVFARLKAAGRELASEEWRLICLTHNLLKLFRAGAQPAAD